jgi:ferredoxin--NADP+ reductase
VIGVVGFRDRSLLFWDDKFRKVCDEFIVCTDDGSYGHHGFVTDVLKEVCEKEKPAQAVLIGPVPMMKFASLVTKEYNIPTLVSLNPIMVDGTGMCGGCRVTIGGKTKFACVDGPEFDGHQVDYDELMARLQAYCEQEKQCYEDFCHLEQA